MIRTVLMAGLAAAAYTGAAATQAPAVLNDFPTEARADYARFDGRRRDFRELTLRYRERLGEVYRQDMPDSAKRQRKAELMAQMRAEYAVMKRERWDGFAGYDGWFERANNASLGVLAAYNALVPGFERLFEREGRDFPRFYAEVRRLAALPKDERRAALEDATSATR